MDVYPIALVLFGIATVATLGSLKSTLGELRREQQNRKKVRERVEEGEGEKNGKGNSCRILKYLLKNYTILLVFSGNTGFQLLSLLFSYSIVGMFLFYSKFWYPTVGFAAIVSVTAIVLQLLQEKSIKPQTTSETEQNNKKTVKGALFVLMALTTVSLYLSLFGLCFKNYINSRLSPMLINFAISFMIDNILVKPFIFLSIALMVGQNKLFQSIIEREQSKVVRSKVANNFEKQPQTRQHIVLNLEVQPQPIEFSRSREFNRSRVLNQNIMNAPVALPSSSIIDTIQIHQDASVENMISRVQSRKSGINKLTSMKELNEVQLQKIEQNPGYQLKQYFCMNLRRDRQQEQQRHMQVKIQGIANNKSNVQTAQLVQEFILQDFICRSPREQQVDMVECKSSKYSKSKGSLRSNKTFRILQREKQAEVEQKENQQSTKHEISEQEIPLPTSHCSNRNKTHILKISAADREVGQLEEIDINSPNRRARNHYDTHVIPEEIVRSKRKRNRRGTTKEVSQPYLLQEKLVQAYFPGKTKSEFDTLVRRRKNFDRSQFFNTSNRKQPSRSKEKPIVHESEDQHTEFFVPRF